MPQDIEEQMLKRVLELKSELKAQEEKTCSLRKENETLRFKVKTYETGYKLLQSIYDSLVQVKNAGTSCPVCGAPKYHYSYCWWPFVVDFLNEPLSEQDIAFLKLHRKSKEKEEEA